MIIVLLFSLALVNKSFAFRITPASFEIDLKRGETKTEFLTINNDSDDSIQCQVYATGYQVGRDGKPVFEETEETDTSPFSARKMIKILEPEITIPAKSGKRVAISVTLPRTVSEREYFATIMAVTQAASDDLKKAQQKKVTTQMKINLRLGVILRINVAGPTVFKKAEISEVKVEKETQGVKVIATLENKCSVHLETEEAETVIKDLNHRIMAKFPLQGANKEVRGDKVFIYPQASRDFWGVVDKPLPPGKYLAEIIFNYGYRSRKIRRETAFEIEKELGDNLQKWMVMNVEPSTIKMEMKQGTLKRETVKIFNQDVNPLKVQVSAKVFINTHWLEVAPTELTIKPQSSEKIRIIATLPSNENVARVGKILIKPERGNESSVDIVVVAPEKKSEKKREGNKK